MMSEKVSLLIAMSLLTFCLLGFGLIPTFTVSLTTAHTGYIPSSHKDSDTNPHSELCCAQTLNPGDQRTRKQNKKPSHDFALSIHRSSVAAVTHLLTPLRNSIFNRTRPHPSILIELSGSADSCSTLLSLAALGANSICVLSWIRRQGPRRRAKLERTAPTKAGPHSCICFFFSTPMTLFFPNLTASFNLCQSFISLQSAAFNYSYRPVDRAAGAGGAHRPVRPEFSGREPDVAHHLSNH